MLLLLLWITHALAGWWPFDDQYQQTLSNTEMRVNQQKNAISVYGMKDCAQRVYDQLDIQCADMNTDQNIRFASLLTICHLENTRKSTNKHYSCDSTKSGKDCSSQFSEADSHTFDLFYLHVKDVCVVAEQYNIRDKISGLLESLMKRSLETKDDFEELSKDINLSREELNEAKNILTKDISEMDSNLKYLYSKLEEKQKEHMELSKELTHSVNGIVSSLVEFKNKALGQLSDLLGGLNGLSDGQKELKGLAVENLRTQQQMHVQVKVNGEELGKQSKTMEDLKGKAQESLELLQDILYIVQSIKDIQQKIKDDFVGFKGMAFYIATLIAVFLFTSSQRTAAARVPLVFWTLGMATGYKVGYFSDGWEYHARSIHLIVCISVMIVVVWYVPTDMVLIYRQVQEIKETLDERIPVVVKKRKKN
jgi:hypothetical protein